VLPGKARKRLVRALRELMPALGAARDWDVFTAWLESAAAPASLQAQAHAQRTAARRRARRLLSSHAWRAFVAQAGAMRATAASAPLGEFAASAIERAHRKALKQARGVDWRDASERHALRVRLKRLRYTCDFLAPSFAARPAAAYLESLKRLQDILGELNDLRVGRALLSRMKGSARTVNRSLAAREAVLLRQLAPAWRALESRAPFWRPRG